jgi:hypothetical protein
MFLYQSLRSARLLPTRSQPPPLGPTLRGNFLGWGVVVPLYAVAILTTRVLSRWMRMAWPARRGARWMVGLAQPGIVGDHEYLQHRLLRFMLSMGVALLRRRLRPRRSPRLRLLHGTARGVWGTPPCAPRPESGRLRAGATGSWRTPTWHRSTPRGRRRRRSCP